MLVKYLSECSDRRVKMADREMLVTTTENIPGRKYEITVIFVKLELLFWQLFQAALN